jgi:(heptosyl)LPS beta-1,4-glucosyltransferase
MTSQSSTLAAVIIAKNEAAHISQCLATLDFADERVVLTDPINDDNTVELARAAGATVLVREFDNFAGQRNAALESVSADWVFFVDADERITPDLAVEVRRVIAERPEAGWWEPRHNFIVGQSVRHGGFYPDYQLRLLRRSQARYDPERPVHEVVLLDGPSGYLQQVMIHYNYATWTQFHAKQRRYARFEGRILAERGIRPWPHKFITVPGREFRRRYLSLAGYRDGWIGLKLAFLLSFYYGFMPHWYLLRKI